MSAPAVQPDGAIAVPVLLHGEMVSFSVSTTHRSVTSARKTSPSPHGTADPAGTSAENTNHNRQSMSKSFNPLKPWTRPLFLTELDGFLSYQLRAQTRTLYPLHSKKEHTMTIQSKITVKPNIHRLTDISKSAYLIVKGCRYIGAEQITNRCHFNFESPELCRRHLQEIEAGAAVNMSEFLTAVTTLKNALREVRESV
jgi:hypothetical protein